MEPVELTNGHVYLLVDTSVQGVSLLCFVDNQRLRATVMVFLGYDMDSQQASGTESDGSFLRQSLHGSCESPFPK